MSESSAASTNAVKWLHAQGVDFRVLEYEFTQIGADHAAAAVGRPLEMVCKTLVVRAGAERAGTAHYIAIVPGDVRFDTRRMAAAIGAPHAELADQDEAERITGYKVGGISPFALRRKLPVFVEESLLALETLIVNGGRRGVLVELRTEDVVRLLDATAADLCHG